MSVTINSRAAAAASEHLDSGEMEQQQQQWSQSMVGSDKGECKIIPF